MRTARFTLSRLALLAVVATLGACYYPAPYPAPAPYASSTFDRSFDAALGAITDQGLRITAQDRSTGIVVGSSGPVSATATIRPQADGTTRVEFKTSGDVGGGLSQRVLAAYNARMGR